ncbi:MAG: glutamate--tRNA ligase [Alphaproteobacteria bacterium]|nr:glutamate--tRNA ligase [Alphaproteobacteria bacterium]
MTTLVRFAPSPTGQIHLGNTFIALVNWLHARKTGGDFLLRMDDTDVERSTVEYMEGIKADLTWLGLDWDRYEQQSLRTDRYDAAAEKLKQMGRLYPCYETPEELGLKRKAQLNAGRPPVYDRAALKLTDAERAAFEADGRKPHWRFKLDQVVVSWTDMTAGPQHYDLGSVSDPVLIRENGIPVYTLASVVDDGEMGVTDVIRGHDHLPNQAVQMQLLEALGFDQPKTAHLPLLMGMDGKPLSKRLDSNAVSGLRGLGFEPQAVTSLLLCLGQGDAPEPIITMDALVEAFDLGNFGRATPKFALDDMKTMNGRVLHALAYEAVADRLTDMGIEGGAAFWEVARNNVTFLTDAKEWWEVIKGPIEPQIDSDDVAFMMEASGLFPDGEVTGQTWDIWTKEVKEATGRKGKTLFKPLRLALTARDHGPELKDLLPLIGRDRCLARLTGDFA